MSALVSHVLDAHAAMIAPKSVDLEHAGNAVICTLTAFTFCVAFDRLVARKFKRPYMCLHVAVNIVITALTFSGAVRALMEPSSSTVVTPGEAVPNSLYICWVYALHIYHPIAFKTGVMDWVHHVPVYIINTMSFSVPLGDAILLQILILTGIPGGMDYFLQVLEGEGRLSRASYKEYCSRINTWIRAPLGTISSYICFLGLYNEWEHASVWTRFVLFALGLHAAWNPPFFARQAIEANVVDVVNRYGLVGSVAGKEGIKLPQVRSLMGKTPKAPVPTTKRAAEPPPYPINQPSEISPTTPMVSGFGDAATQPAGGGKKKAQ